jgi:hypothetical protein
MSSGRPGSIGSAAGGRLRRRAGGGHARRDDVRARRPRHAEVPLVDGLARCRHHAGVFDVMHRASRSGGARLRRARPERTSGSRLRQRQPRPRLRRRDSRWLDGRGLGGRSGHGRHPYDGGLRHRCGLALRLWRGRSDRRRHCWQEQQRIDVALGILHAPHAHVDERLGEIGLAGRADRADALALGDARAAPNREGAEMQQRDREPVAGQQGQRLPAVRNGAGERDGRVDRCPHRRARCGADVDAAVLPWGLRIRVGEIEWPQNGPRDRPRPRRRRRRKD